MAEPGEQRESIDYNGLRRMQRLSLRTLLLAAFTLSGFSGLIYESLWTHYLKLFLGHAAHAQTLVLAIFMGGLAVGSWICSRRSTRWRNLLRGYAVAEGIIGVAGLLFHWMFTSTVDLAFTAAIPALGSPSSVAAFKWVVGSALILPQSILLGTTFPLMAGGFVRRFPHASGEGLALLYFANSIGGAAGVLASGFVLIPRFGLPGTGALVGLINIALAVGVWYIAADREQPAVAAAPAGDTAAGRPLVRAGYALMLTVSLLTGAASFIYEIGWIRMLSLVLGSSTQAFELMVSAFILGLALGGLWIRRRIDRLVNPVGFLGVVQVAMGSLAVATMLLYGSMFPLMRWLVETLPKDSTGYLVFNLSSHAIALAIMLPATFCAGTTLPLITVVLLRAGRGEASIGAVYAANTVGAILGVAVAVHFGLPIIGLKNTLCLGAALDIALGLVLLWQARSASAAATRLQIVAPAAVVWIALVAFLLEFDRRVLASGVFRQEQAMLTADQEIVFHRDGKTATIDVAEQTGVLTIRTNGKIDASVNMGAGPATRDEPTQVLSAALPLLMRPSSRLAANIGLGSGVTTHVLLTVPSLERVVSVEIEQAMVDGAQQFRPRNERAFSDPRSLIVVDDAKTYFSSSPQRYDIIVSEPSNPWVSGTASLFSTEFYRLIHRHLVDHGVFVQWLQLYEFELDLVASVLKALGESFDDYAIYAAVSGDMLIVAAKGAPAPQPTADLAALPGLAAELRRVDIRSLDDIRARRIADRTLLEPWLRTRRIPANSDYRPVLADRAARARFLQRDATRLTALGLGVVPVLEMLGGAHTATASELTQTPYFPLGMEPFVPRHIRAALGGTPAEDPWQATRRGEGTPRSVAAQLLSRCNLAVGERERADTFYAVGSYVAGYPGSTPPGALYARLTRLPCASFGQVDDWLELFKAVSERRGDAMASRAERLLTGGADSPDRRAYLVAVGMLGHLAEARRDRAASLYRQHRATRAPASLEFVTSVLAAHASAR